ncbi:MAG: BMC domain-containing protein [Eubacteriales bacterium]
MALGLIETVGMVAAIEAADTAVKSANVSLIGIELTKGGGMVVVKLQGDVGAVNAAVAAGVAAVEKIGKVYSYKVIPRPHKELSEMIFSKETKGYIPEAREEAIEEVIIAIIDATCNLCNDPKCPRKKGEPKNLCINR